MTKLLSDCKSLSFLNIIISTKKIIQIPGVSNKLGFNLGESVLQNISTINIQADNEKIDRLYLPQWLPTIQDNLNLHP